MNKDQLTIESPGSPSSKQIKTEPPVQASSTAAALNTEPETTQANKKSANRAPSSSDKLKSVLASKKRIIHRYFDELSQAYVQSHNRDFSDFNRRGSQHSQHLFQTLILHPNSTKLRQNQEHSTVNSSRRNPPDSLQNNQLQRVPMHSQRQLQQRPLLLVKYSQLSRLRSFI